MRNNVEKMQKKPKNRSDEWVIVVKRRAKHKSMAMLRKSERKFKRNLGNS